MFQCLVNALDMSWLGVDRCSSIVVDRRLSVGRDGSSRACPRAWPEKDMLQDGAESGMQENILRPATFFSPRTWLNGDRMMTMAILFFFWSTWRDFHPRGQPLGGKRTIWYYEKLDTPIVWPAVRTRMRIETEALSNTTRPTQLVKKKN